MDPQDVRREDLAAVVLAAGAGTRLRPLTYLRPKALCPVGGRPLIDHALDRAERVTDRIAVNVHHGRSQLIPHCAGRAHISLEDPQALETAGALGALRPWIDGRDVLILNSDAWHPQDLRGFVAGWDGERVRLLTVNDPERGDFGDLRYTGVALLPWQVVRDLPAERLGLYPAVLRPHREAGRLDLAESPVPHHDCGTPREYLDANLAALRRERGGGRGADGCGGDVVETVVEVGAVVAGRTRRCVVWAGSRVAPHEHLVDAIRAPGGVTVRVSTPVRPE